MEQDAGLKRALTPGDEVILTTGATAIVRGSYPQGYAGAVAIRLYGADELERASALTLPGKPPSAIGPEPNDSTDAQAVETGNTRAPSRRMED